MREKKCPRLLTATALAAAVLFRLLGGFALRRPLLVLIIFQLYHLGSFVLVLVALDDLPRLRCVETCEQRNNLCGGTETLVFTKSSSQTRLALAPPVVAPHEV